MEAHGKRSEIRCGVCNKTFKSDRGLECHISTHKELKFPCEYCGKIYPSMYRIKRHIKRAHVPNHCEECKEVFYDRAQYTKHIKQHNANKVSECEYCQKQFDKAKNLSEHIRLQHKQDEEKKKCSICGKEFINNALLKNHVKTHDKCFKCPHCDRFFSSRYNLETHSVTHSGARNHKCTICDKSYSTKSSLKNHIATHSEERLFQCERCAKTFKTYRRLYVHKTSHATEEKYQCEICLQKFRVKQYLKYHMNKHSNNKPFECTVCKKRFKHKKSKEKHMLIGKHKFKEENEHDCDFCDETFPTRDLLLDHFSAVHHEENIINNLSDCKDGDESMDVLEEPEEIVYANTVKEECVGEGGMSSKAVDFENYYTGESVSVENCTNNLMEV
nr:zinc finger protein 888-like [Leptinotarsa decemlineata]